MTARSIASELVCVIVFAGCLMALPVADGEPTGEDNETGRLDTVLGKLGTEGEFGLSLKLDKGGALRIADTLADAAPSEIADAFPIIKYLRETDSPDLEKYILSVSPELKALTITAEGDAYLYLTSEKVPDGYDYTIRFNGSLKASESSKLNAVDPQNPGKEMGYDAEIMVTVDAVAVVHANKDAIPQSISAKAVVSADGLGLMNYEVHSKRGEVSYTYVDAERDPVDIGYVLEFQGSVSGEVTRADIDTIVSGESLNRRVYVASSTLEVNNGRVAMSGIEASSELDLSKVYSEIRKYLEDEGPSTDIPGTEGPGYTDSVYFILQEFLQNRCDVFLSEQTYRDLIDAGKAIWTQLRDGKLDFFYSFGDNIYNTAIKDSIVAKLDTEMEPMHERIVESDGDYQLSYRKANYERYVDVEIEGAEAPEEIRGFPVYRDGYRDDDYQRTDGNRIEIYTYNIGSGSWDVWFHGDAPDEVSMVIDGIDNDTRSKVKCEVVQSGSFDKVWCARISISDNPYGLFGKEIHIGNGFDEKILVLHSRYGDNVSVIEGVIYAHDNIGSASVIGLIGSTSTSTVTIKKAIGINDNQFNIRYVWIHDSEVGELILDTGEWGSFYYVDLQGSNIGKLIIQGHGYVDFDRYKGLENVKELALDKTLDGVYGIISMPGWSGAGSTFIVDGVEYLIFNSRGEELVKVINITGSSVVIPATVSFGEKEYAVGEVNIHDKTIQKLEIRGGNGNAYIHSSTIGELRSNYIPYFSQNSTVGKFVLVGDAPIRVDCYYLADMNAGSVEFNAPISYFSGDITLLSKYGMETVTVDGIVYLKTVIQGKNVMYIVRIVEGDDLDVTIHGSFQYDGVDYPILGTIDASENRNIRNVIVESVPDQGIYFYKSSLKSLIFNNVDPIDLTDSNFRACDQLNRVEFNGPVKTIPRALFNDSTEIRTLNFSGSIDNIGDYAFASNGYIENLVFNGTIGKISYESFGSFTKLKSVTFKGDVTSVDKYAFNACSKLESITFEGNLGILQMFRGCNAIKNITVGGNVGLIDTAAFHYDDVSSIENLDLSARHYDRVDYFAFNGLKVSEKIVNEILNKSDHVSPDAFYDVDILGNDGYETYVGICSNNFEPKEAVSGDFVFEYTEYIENNKVSLNIIGLRIAEDVSSTDINYRIPDGLNIGEVYYPITGIAYHRSIGFNNQITALTIGKDIKLIGSLSLFPQLKNITIEEGSPFVVEKFGSGGNVLELLCGDLDGKRTVICNIGVMDVEEFTIPSGIEVFDLDWILGSTIKKMVSGDDVKEINGQLSMIHGLNILILGKNVEYINPNWITRDVSIAVSDGNPHYISHEGGLYAVLSDNKLELIHYGGESSTVPSSISKNDITYEVTRIGDAAFRYCSFEEIILSDGIKDIQLSAFSYTNIKKVTIPDSIRRISGSIYQDSEIGLSNIVLESPDGKTVRTIDGIVYFEKGNSKRVIHYAGGGKETTFIEEGTTSVRLGPIYDDNVKRIILPSTVVSFHGEYRLKEGGIDVLAPSSAYHDLNRFFHLREYTLSEFYDLSFSRTEGGITVSVEMKHAKSPTLILNGVPLTESKISWDKLFPDSGLNDQNYEGTLSVTYEPDTFTVTFVTNSVSTVPEQTIPYGGYVTVPAVPLNGAKIFDGWSTDKEQYWYFDFEGTIVTEDLTLYAIWLEPECNLNVSLCEGAYRAIIGDYWCGDGSSCTLDYGEYKIKVVSERGYTDTPIIRLDGKLVTGDTIVLNKNSMTLTVEGLYKKTNTVHFVNNVSRGTCATDSIKAVSGEPFDLPAVMPSDGYRFIGWTDGVTIYSGPCTVYDDASLFAAYVRDPQKMEFFLSEYTVSLSVPANGTLSSSAFFKADKGDTVSLPNVISASGYRFNGWTLDGTNVGTSYTVLEDATLVASISKVGTSVPDTPKPDPKPDTPKPEEKVNEDGSTTVIDKKEDGSSVETTTKNNDDGSTVVKTEEKDKDGNTTGTTTKVTKSDGSSTEVKESKTENGSSVKEETFDKDGVSLGSTTKVTKKVTTDSGTTLRTEKVTATDGTGEKIAETVTVKAESGDGKLKSEATRTEKDGNVESVVRTTIESDAVDGKVELDSAAVSDALKQMGEAAVAIGDADSKVIEIGTKATTDTTHVSIPSESMKEISDAGADVKIAGDVGTITIGTDVSKNLAEKSSSGEQTKPVSMSIGKADKVSMTDKQRQAVGDAKVVRLQASVGDESVHELGGDVTITIPYVLSPGENPDLVRVYYVDDEGGLHMKLSKYDPSTHTVSFVTDHFSYYMIAQEIGAEQTVDDGEDSFPMVAVVAVVVVIVVLAAVAVYRRIR